MRQYQVVIVGAGPAALCAGTFLARANITALIIGDPAQSGLADAAEVWNYPGFPKGISGRELLDSMREQAVSQGAEFLLGEVTHVEKVNTEQHSHILKNMRMSGMGFLVRTAKREEFYAERLLFAHGANFIKTNLPGEKELVGKGIHYCALCDGPIYKGRSVIVLGNSNLAAEEALQLVGAGAKVSKIITHAISANISPEYQKLLDEKKIPVEIGKAEKFSAGITINVKKTTGPVEERAEAVFVALGVASSLTFAQKLGLEMYGNFLKADENGRTNISGVWVAGLARGGVNQVGKSVGEATVAAVDIIKAVKGLPQYLDHT
jgi:thioredoxin reductase (NADPH)